MQRKIIGLFVLVSMLFIVTSAVAGTIKLKNGKIIEGEILEKTDQFIKVDFYGVPLAYYFDEIESINGEKVQESNSGVEYSDAVSEKDDISVDDKTQRKGFLGGVIGRLERDRIERNEKMTMSNLRVISNAVEGFANDHEGIYPGKEEDLTGGEHPYSSQSFNNQQILGYKYSIQFRPNGYKIIATPVECGKRGTKIFSREVVLSEKSCGGGNQEIKNNDNQASDTVRSMASAIERFAGEHKGRYPTGESELKLEEAEGSYLLTLTEGRDWWGYEYYDYSINYRSNGYTITATPIECDKTGTKIIALEVNESQDNCEQ